MMYAVIGANFFGFAASAAMQSIVSNAADPRVQGQTLGTVSSINSLMAVLAPLLGAPLLAAVSHLPPGDWRIGLPYYVCAVLQAAAAAQEP
jgi:DHA1 family tetracycline resistance protein-like MFS transporter